MEFFSNLMFLEVLISPLDADDIDDISVLALVHQNKALPQLTASSLDYALRRSKNAGVSWLDLPDR